MAYIREMEEKTHLNALNLINGVGPQKMKMLLDFFGSAEKAWKAGAGELSKSGIGEALTQKVITDRIKVNPDEEWEKLAKENIKIISFLDDNYPQLLKEISSPPSILYIKTNLSDFSFDTRPMVAIVGSRKFTQYGRQVAENFARDLAHAGITVVSGMALGIDSFAHRGALQGGGETVAILGSSLEDQNIGPRTNFELSRNIMGSGALVSDFPLGIPSAPHNFPARNRIMAGLTLGTIVVEAALASGTLITANLALEFNREVFAVPGSIFSPQSEGANNLIRSGAKIVTSVKDVLEELRLEKRAQAGEMKKIIPASKDEEIILSKLSHEPTHIDTISKLTKLGTSVVGSTLSIMEMKGMVKNIGGQNYIIL